jgi:hypothetical protein
MEVEARFSTGQHHILAALFFEIKSASAIRQPFRRLQAVLHFRA